MECAICLENLSPTTENRRLPCHWSHVFCISCLNNIIERRNYADYFTCPVCQTNIKYPEGGIEAFRKIDIKMNCMDNYQLEINNEKERLKSKRKLEIDNLYDKVKCVKQSIDNERNNKTREIHKYYANMEQNYNNLQDDIEKYKNLEKNSSNSVQNRKLITFKEKITCSVDKNLNKDINLNILDDANHLKLGKIFFQHEENPYNEYYRNMPENYTVSRGINCFYIFYDKDFFEWNNNGYNRFNGIKVTDSNINYLNDFYVYQLSPLNNHENGTIFKWDNHDKSFKTFYRKNDNENNKSFNNDEDDYGNDVCFVSKTNLILLNTNSGRLTIINLHYDLSCWIMKCVEDDYLYFLRDGINLQYYVISQLKTGKMLFGNNILIDVIYEKLSIKYDLIKEITKNKKILLTNQQFVFILNPDNKSAKAYPQRNVFKEGILKTYFMDDKHIHFSVLCSNLQTNYCLVKTFEL